MVTKGKKIFKNALIGIRFPHHENICFPIIVFDILLSMTMTMPQTYTRNKTKENTSYVDLSKKKCQTMVANV